MIISCLSAHSRREGRCYIIASLQGNRYAARNVNDLIGLDGAPRSQVKDMPNTHITSRPSVVVSRVTRSLTASRLGILS